MFTNCNPGDSARPSTILLSSRPMRLVGRAEWQQEKKFNYNKKYKKNNQLINLKKYIIFVHADRLRYMKINAPRVLHTVQLKWYDRESLVFRRRAN